MNLPLEGVVHNRALVFVRKRYPGLRVNQRLEIHDEQRACRRARWPRG